MEKRSFSFRVKVDMKISQIHATTHTHVIVYSREQKDVKYFGLILFLFTHLYTFTDIFI